MSFLESVGNRCPSIVSKIHLVTGPGQKLPNIIPQAVVFVHATWSAASGAALSALGQVLPGSTAAAVPVFVVDADALADDLHIGSETERPQGNGETYLVRDGKIIERLSGYSSVNISYVSDALSRVFS